MPPTCPHVHLIVFSSQGHIHCPVTRKPPGLSPAHCLLSPESYNQLSGPPQSRDSHQTYFPSLISAEAAPSLHRSMGSASPGLSNVSPGCLLLFPDVAPRTGTEKAASGAMGPEKQEWSPSPPATPEQGLSAFYLSYFNMYPDDSSWVAKVPEARAGEDHPEEPEQCPVIDSQASGSTLDEHSLEQVQSMVVGEVLKDIETACKLLNITAGETVPAASAPGASARPGIQAGWRSARWTLIALDSPGHTTAGVRGHA